MSCVVVALSAPAQQPETFDSDRINAALRDNKDVWGEAIIASGGATYENVQGYLPPLFLSTGKKNTDLGVHNLLFGADGGEPPYIIPLADGSRIYADHVNSDRFVEFFVGKGASERYGSKLARLDGPYLEDGYYPILKTVYTDELGHRFEQTCFAARLPGMKHDVAFIEVRCTPNPMSDRPVLRRKYGRFVPDSVSDPLDSRLHDEDSVSEVMDAVNGNNTRRIVWSPRDPLPDQVRLDEESFSTYKRSCRDYWDSLLAKGAQFDVPEPIAMNCRKNLLIQNLVMRWRYSVGAVVYHGEFYQPESSDALTTLGQYGYLDAYRDGLRDILPKTKGKDFYLNWERGEKLSHGAHYYWLTRDNAYIQANSDAYVSICDALAQQIETDPNGLLHKQRQCGDIPDVGYFVWHQTVCWRGLRDMAEVWRAIGNVDLADTYRATADRFRDAIARAIAQSQTMLDDGSRFVPRRLLEPEPEVFDPITDTKLGSYWNLCMPYTFASGFWEPRSADMDGFVRYMHDHGSIMLGLLRFNYYPTPIGQVTKDGLPGYMTTGFDNVYLPAYIQLMADRDEADRLLLTFYSKLANGQTRNTFVSGEGETVGAVPEMTYRSSYGSPCSANNTVFLQALRLLLVRESYDHDTGAPKGLYLAHATPRQWLEPGKRIAVTDAPTCFGKVSYTLTSDLENRRIFGQVRLPSRNTPTEIAIKLRVPRPYALNSIRLDGKEQENLNVRDETVVLTGMTGVVGFEARYE